MSTSPSCCLATRPSDSGFDNNGDVLSITTAHTRAVHVGGAQDHEIGDRPAQRRLASRRSMSRCCFCRTTGRTKICRSDRGRNCRAPNFPSNGEYLIKVRLRTNWQDYILGMGRAATARRAFRWPAAEAVCDWRGSEGPAGSATFTIAEFGDPEWEEYLHRADEGLEIRVPVTAGPHLVGVSFVRQRPGTGRRFSAAASRRGVVERRGLRRKCSGQLGRDRRSL